MTVFLTILAISATVTLIPLGQPASAKSMYDLGYDHGCTDANAGGHPYLESPGKGPSFHTDAFMQGYNDGYSACSHSTVDTPRPQDTPNTGSYSQGLNDGKAKARQDHINGDKYNSYCGIGHPDSYCLGYKAGYAAGWGAAPVLLHNRQTK